MPSRLLRLNCLPIDSMIAPLFLPISSTNVSSALCRTTVRTGSGSSSQSSMRGRSWSICAIMPTFFPLSSPCSAVFSVSILLKACVLTLLIWFCRELKPENSLMLWPFSRQSPGMPPGTVELTLFLRSSKMLVRALFFSSTMLEVRSVKPWKVSLALPFSLPNSSFTTSFDFSATISFTKVCPYFSCSSLNMSPLHRLATCPILSINQCIMIYP